MSQWDEKVALRERGCSTNAEVQLFTISSSPVHNHTIVYTWQKKKVFYLNYYLHFTLKKKRERERVQSRFKYIGFSQTGTCSVRIAISSPKLNQENKKLNQTSGSPA